MKRQAEDSPAELKRQVEADEVQEKAIEAAAADGDGQAAGVKAEMSLNADAAEQGEEKNSAKANTSEINNNKD